MHRFFREIISISIWHATYSSHNDAISWISRRISGVIVAHYRLEFVQVLSRVEDKTIATWNSASGSERRDTSDGDKMVYDEILEIVAPLYRSVVKLHVGLAYICIQRHGQSIRHPCNKYSRFRMGYYTRNCLHTHRNDREWHRQKLR